MRIRSAHAHLFALSAVLVAITYATLLPYGMRPSALFHMDERVASSIELPRNFIVLTVPGYDGMSYYNIAQSLPDSLLPDAWPSLRESPTTSYSYQRMLLPVLAALVSLGYDPLLPWTFLLINLASLLGCAVLMLRFTRDGALPAWALALCPAALLGIHFSLAEPLSLLLVTWFLIRNAERGMARMSIFDTLLLSLAVLTREINLLFVLGVGAYALLRRQWRSALLTVIPLATFGLLHGWIFAAFGELPFFTSTGKSDLPFSGIVSMLRDAFGGGMKGLSALALFLGFVVPAFLLSLRELLRERALPFVATGLAAFLLVMLLMADHIWGSMTSIGRVITPVYSLFAVFTAERPTMPNRVMLGTLIMLGLVTGLGLSLIIHPFMITP